MAKTWTGVDEPIRLKHKAKQCERCSGKYIPTSNNQKYCPECRKQIQKYGSIKQAYENFARACQPSEVKVYNINDVKAQEENMLTFTETSDRPALPEGWQEGQKKIELPDWDAFVAQATEILLKYGRGELVDKTEFLARIRERLGEF